MKSGKGAGARINARTSLVNTEKNMRVSNNNILIMVILTAIVQMTAVAKSELIQNGGFESGIKQLPFGKDLTAPRNWGYWERDVSLHVVSNAKLARSGRNFVRLDRGGICKLISDRIRIDKYDKYLVQMWVRRALPKSKFNVAIYEYAFTPRDTFIGAVKLKHLKPLRIFGEWELIQGVYIPKCAKSSSKYEISLAKTLSNEISLDDVSFQRHKKTSLNNQIIKFNLRKKLEPLNRRLKNDPDLSTKFKKQLDKLSKSNDSICDQSKTENLSPEQIFDMRKQFDAIKTEYKKLRWEVAFSIFDEN